MYFFFSSQNFRRGGALAPPMDEPPLVHRYYRNIRYEYTKM